MTDVKIENGDIVLDSSGRAVMLNDTDAKFQRAVICICSRKGMFIYDRELGSDVGCISADEKNSAEKAELEINAALAKFKNTFARVIEYGEKLKIELTIDGETRITEVLLNGNI